MDELEERLTKTERRMDYPNLRPKDAATLLVLDTDRDGDPRVLMGRRHERHRFMPGKFVFPGGRVDPGDCRAGVAADYDPVTYRQLLFDMKKKPTEARARGLAIAAIRETYEEAGLYIGRKQRSHLPGGAGLKPFVERAVALDLAPLRFIGRAITPPRRPRRFDTRFFAVFADAIADRTPEGVLPSGELEEIRWLSLDDAKSLDLPTITLVMIEELQRRLAADRTLSRAQPVPYYYWARNRFNRTVIEPE
ncbi:MAG: NUDIX hydrolase [Pseudomonadota bacterium]